MKYENICIIYDTYNVIYFRQSLYFKLNKVKTKKNLKNLNKIINAPAFFR